MVVHGGNSKLDFEFFFRLIEITESQSMQWRAVCNHERNGPDLTLGGQKDVCASARATEDRSFTDLHDKRLDRA